MTNDVQKESFKSLLDPMFRSDFKEPVRKRSRRKTTFNSRNLGRGMMPPVHKHRKKTTK